MKLLTIFLVFYIFHVEAEGIKSGVLSFLMPTESLNTKTVGGITNNSTKECYTGNVADVICNKNPSAYQTKYESSTKINGYDISNHEQTVSVATAGTNSNQNTMQDQNFKNAMGKYQGGMSLPLAPSDNVKMNINQRQLQFNIKY